MTNETRKKILAAADPSNFPKLKYESPPSSNDGTDCSHFVNNVYSSGGLKFPYQSTSQLPCLSRLKDVTEKELQAGDLVLFDGHVGIYTGDGKIVSATVGGVQRRSALDPGNPYFIPTIKSLKIDQFGKPTRFLTWSCDT